MLIVCLSCAARYDVPERMTRAALVMRCAGCGHEFSAPAAIAEAVIAEAAITEAALTITGRGDAVPAFGGAQIAGVPADGVADDRAGDDPRPGSTEDAAGPLRARVRSLLHGTAPSLLGWVASLGFLFLAGQTAIDHRDGIMQAWPPSRRLFLWLGMG